MEQPIKPPTPENKEEKRKKLIEALKKETDEGWDLLDIWIKEKEKNVKESKDPHLATIMLNLERARLYFEVGTEKALKESLSDYEDAIDQANNENRTELMNEIIQEENEKFGEPE